MRRLPVLVTVVLGVLVVSLDGTGRAGAADGPVVGPPHTVAQSQAFHSDAGSNGIASAYDGTNLFVVWTDARGGASTPDIYGARVAPDGEVIDVAGVPIATATGRQNNPDVVFDGSNFLVVWTNRGAFPNRVEAARVSPEGSLIDSPPLVLGEGRTPVVAAAEGVSAAEAVSLVAWTTLSSVRAARISPDGAVLDPAPGVRVVDDPTGASVFPDVAVASDGTDFLVGYEVSVEGDTWIEFTEVSADGSLGASRGAPSGRQPSLASNGTDYVLAWTGCREIDCEFGGNTDIFTVRVSSDLSLSPITVAATGPSEQSDPDIAWNAGRFLVAYRRQALDGETRVGPVDIRASMLNTDGSDVLAEGFIVDADVYGTSTTTRGQGDDFSIVYEDLPRSASPVLFRTVSPK